MFKVLSTFVKAADVVRGQEMAIVCAVGALVLCHHLSINEIINN